jgi:enoyl-CoA hydratase
VSDQEVVLTERRDRVFLITLNRPEVRNAINGELSENLAVALDVLDSDPELSVGVLTGAGAGFCAGMDLKAFTSGQQRPAGEPRSSRNALRDGSRKPVVVAIEGFAMAAGLEMALSFDLIVAARGARLGIPETRRGLFAAAGGLYRLPRWLGLSRAMEMALTGDPILAEEAHQLGMVARLTEPGGALAAALDLAGRIARNGPLGIAASKQLIRDALGMSEADFWQHQDPLRVSVFGSADAREGALAFLEKRDPNWSGS